MDVGMYDGADTAYYLDLGYRVVAVEANPRLAEAARERFSAVIESGDLIVEEVAIADEEGSATLHLSDRDLGSSSLVPQRVAGVSRKVTVPTVPFDLLLARHGRPHYLKCDIEGADWRCILALTPESRPAYVSFEAGERLQEMVEHLEGLGYDGFKAIHQSTFRELRRVNGLPQRLSRRLGRMIGRDEGRVRIGGRSFVSEHSSGPMAEATDGAWRSGGSVVRDLTGSELGGWYDVHARLSRELWPGS